MNPIKFRAWNNLTKKMFTPEYFNFTNGELICIDGDSIVPYGNIELMRFTGLLDRKGVEIYENDIAKYSIGWGGDRNEEKNHIMSIGVVGFKYGMFGFVDDDGRIFVLIDKFMPTVRGNIYENPELLELK